MRISQLVGLGVVPICGCLLTANSIHGFAPVSRTIRTVRPVGRIRMVQAALQQTTTPVSQFQRLSPLMASPSDDANSSMLSMNSWTEQEKKTAISLIASTPVVYILLNSLPAQAADGSVDFFFPIASALAAYLHYIGILSAMGCLVAERLILSRTNFGQDDEDLLTKVDIAYGLVGIPVLVSGYYRVTEYGKGFDFYKNEPFFWIKIASAGLLAACSFFTTGIIIKRAVDQKNNDNMYTDMSPALMNRLKSVINAELTGIFFIPLFATLMARGVGYTDVIPWQAEAALAGLVFAGASFKYVKDAVTWSDK